MIKRPRDWSRAYAHLTYSVESYHSRLPAERKDLVTENILKTIESDNDLTSVSGPKSPLQFLSELTRHVFDLDDTFRTLTEIDELVRRKVSLPKTVTTDRFRKILHETHIEEMYLFSLRSENLITFLLRQYQHESYLSNARILGSQLKQTLKDRFAQINKIRGNHTHQVRFSNIIDDFTRFEFLRGLAEDINWAPLNQAVKEAKKDYLLNSRRMTRGYTLSAKGALNGVGGLLLGFVYDDTHEFAIPRKYNEI